MSTIAYIAAGLVAAYLTQRLLRVRLGIWRRLVVTVIGALAAWEIASHGNYPLIALMGAVITSALAAVVLEVTSNPNRPADRSLAISVLGLPRMVGRRISQTERYLQILAIFTRHGFGAYLGIGRRQDGSPRGHRLGRDLREALEESGGVFVKFGQMLANRADVVPPALVEELRRLDEHAAPVPEIAIARVVMQELGGDLSATFAHFDAHPVAAASIAQVHRAELPDGRRVAVKIQRPGIAAVVARDLGILEQLAGMADRAWPDAHDLQITDLAEGFSRAMRDELDFRVEARNATIMAGFLKPDASVTVMRVVPELSGPRLLVSEWIDGVSIGQAGDTLTLWGLDGHGLAKQLLGAILHEILIDGTFHADPHPGNVFLTLQGNIVLLDLGSVGRLDRAQQYALRRALYAISRQDPQMMTDAILDLAEATKTYDEEVLVRSVSQFMSQHLAPGMPVDVRMFGALLSLLLEHGLAFPNDLGGVFRALVTLQGTLQRLDPNFDIVKESELATRGLINEVIRPTSIARGIQDDLLELLPKLRRLPRRLDRITTALETGRFQVNVRLFSDAADSLFVRQLADRAILAVLIGVIGLVSVQLAGMTYGPRLDIGFGLLQAAGYLGLAGGFLLLMRLLLAILRDRAV
ncbi:MAG TPA: AarF/UbiB family protein [Candidatus Sulfotelmatobacter sp.]|nr:AarF/UbiB family protein [Candidatus Sulfotelmatobacter sp.]